MSDLIARLKAVHEAATPGPWFKYFDSLAFEGAETADPRTGEPVRGGPEPVYPESSENAALIVLTRNALPEIIAALEERERMRAVVEDIRNVRRAMTGLPGAVFTAPEYDEIIRDVMRDIDRALDALEEKG